jgi:uncharacterized protein YdgA (DUF945 family)
MQMKKVFGVLALVLLLGLAAAPYVFGVRAEASYRAFMARINQEAGDVRMVPESYERGWLSSTAQTRVEVPPGKAVLWLRHRIVHGPFPWDRLRRLELRPVQAIVRTEVGAGPAGTASAALPARTVLALDGAAVTEIGALASQGTAEVTGGESIQWGGVHGEVRVPSDLRRIDGSLKAPGLHLSSAAGQWTLEDLRGRLALRQGAEGLTLGEMSLGASRLAYRPSSQGSAPVSLAGGHLSTESSAQNGQVAVVFDLGLDGLDLQDVHYGPATFRLSLSRLDAVTLGRLRREMRSLEREGLTEQEARAGAVLRLLEWLPRLLAAGPRVDLRLLATAPSGTVRGTGVVWLTPGPDALPVLSLGWLDRVKADAEFRAPAALVDALVAADERGSAGGSAAGGPQQRLHALLEQGYVVKEGRDYVLRARLEGRKLTVNGLPVELSALAASG